MKEIKNITMNGQGWRKYLWIIYFEVLDRMYDDIILSNCVIKNFHMTKWEVENTKWGIAMNRMIVENILKFPELERGIKIK